MKLRPGLKFSDGHPFTADDVVFTFDVYLDEKVHAPQRDLLIVGGKPIEVRKKDDTTVTVTLAEPYAVADRMFDGISILPKHLLAEARAAGTIGRAWGLDTPPASIAGLGPFRLKEYVPGERVVLERNPYYWKRDQRGEALPSPSIVCVSGGPERRRGVPAVPGGWPQRHEPFTAEQFGTFTASNAKQRAVNAGAGIHNFLFFDLDDAPNAAPDVARRLDGFGRTTSGTPSPGRSIGRRWSRWCIAVSPSRCGGRSARRPRVVERSLARPPRSLDRARALLKGIGFRWRDDGTLLDRTGTPSAFP